MTTQVSVDETIWKKAVEYTGIHDADSLVAEALTALVERQAARELVALGGSHPNMEPISPRRATW
jgi:Arc/MetJ family transcription regulator